MSIYDSAFQFATGGVNALLMYQKRIEEKDYAQGASFFLSAVAQIELTTYTLYEISHVINDLAKPLIAASSTTSINYLLDGSIQYTCAVATLALITYAGYARENTQTVVSLKDKVVLFINKHAGNISEGIFLICAIAECALGNPVRGSISLATFVFSYLDRKGYVAFEKRVFLQKRIMPIANALNLVAGETLMKVFSAIDLGIYAVKGLKTPLFWIDRKICEMYENHYPPIELTLPNEAVNDQNTHPKFTADELLNLPNFRDLELDLSHLQRKIAYDINVDVQFNTLKDLFDEIGFEGEAFHRLVKKIGADDRFNRFFNELIGKKPHLGRVKKEGKAWDAFVFEYGKVQIKRLINILNSTEKLAPLNCKEDQERLKSIVQQLSYEGDKTELNDLLEFLEDKPLLGDTKDLEPCIGQAKFVISHIESLLHIIKTSDNQKEKDDAKLQAQYLLSTLAVEAGDYCYLGIKESVKSCFDHILTKGEGTANLQTSLDALAQNLRDQGFNQMYAELAAILSIYDNKHIFQVMKNALGLGIGVSRTKELDTLDMIMSIFFSRQRRIFWISNYKQKIVRKLGEIINKRDSCVADLEKKELSTWMIVRVAKKIHLTWQKFWLNIEIKSTWDLYLSNEKTFEYNAENLVQCAAEHLRSGKTRDRYLEWWQNYVSKVKADDDKTAQLGDMMIDNLFLQNYGNPLNPKLLTVMLIEMGFIKKPVFLPKTIQEKLDSLSRDLNYYSFQMAKITEQA